MNIDRNTLLPQLPNLSELRPFPTSSCLEYDQHEGRVRSIDVDSTGFYLASGGDDKKVLISEIATGRVMASFDFPDVVRQVRWNPNKACGDVLSVACGRFLYFLHTHMSYNEEIMKNGEDLLNSMRKEGTPEAIRGCTWVWRRENAEATALIASEANLLVIEHMNPVMDMSWHTKGDYICVNASTASSSIVFIHQISKGQSQIPIPKLKGIVQRVLFNTTAKPYLFIATQTEVKIYNLVKQTLLNKLRTGVKWVSSMDLHPGGDNLIVGSYDSRLSWFDLDLASTPYKIFRYHKKAIRTVQFHSNYPLMSTCSDDGTIHIFHTTVYNDFIHNALIVPLKVLRGHKVVDELGVLDSHFHPTQPWILTAGADHTIRMYINIP